MPAITAGVGGEPYYAGYYGWRRPLYAGYGWGWRRPYYAGYYGYGWRPRVVAFGW